MSTVTEDTGGLHGVAPAGQGPLQGWRVTDATRLRQLDIPDHETVIEFPRRMMQFFPEVKGGDGVGV